ncbi:MAG: protein kinase domain-containing protein [Planctomycetota bacterium]
MLADGPLSLERGIDALVQATRGLEAAHGAGVIHRDVKPSNLMMLPDATVKVTDFGLAKSLSGDVQATGGGSLMGTPTYISPEQCRGREVNERTDIYLLGLTAWFLFTGKPAYSSKQLGEVLNDQMNTPLPDVLKERPDLPPGLAKLLTKMCEKDPDKRPATMFQVAGALEALRPKPLSPAPITARAAAWAIDMTILSIVLLAVSAAVALLDRWLFTGLLPDFIEGIVAAVVTFLLLAVVEMREGTTFGKMLLNLCVSRLDGNRPSVQAVVLRYLIRYPGTALVPPMIVSSVEHEGTLFLIAMVLQMVAIVLGFVWYFFSGGRTLSDVLTKTRVVYRLPGNRS